MSVLLRRRLPLWLALLSGDTGWPRSSASAMAVILAGLPVRVTAFCIEPSAVRLRAGRNKGNEQENW